MIHNKHKQCIANAATKRKQKYKGHSCGGAILKEVFFQDRNYGQSDIYANTRRG